MSNGIHDGVSKIWVMSRDRGLDLSGFKTEVDAIDHLVRVALVKNVAPETVRAAVEHALKRLDDERHDERSQIDRLTTERDNALARAKNYEALRDGMSDQLEARVGDLGRARDRMEATLRALSIPPELAYEPSGRELAVAVQRVADAARADRACDVKEGT